MNIFLLQFLTITFSHLKVCYLIYLPCFDIWMKTSVSLFWISLAFGKSEFPTAANKFRQCSGNKFINGTIAESNPKAKAPSKSCEQHTQSMNNYGMKREHLS